jgi:hypothetical protein
MTRNDGKPTSEDLAVGSSNQTLIQFSMRANDVSDINVTKMTFASDTGSTVNVSNITNVKLMINGTVVSTKNMST